MKNKKELTEYILTVDQEELGILEDEFDDLKYLFKVKTCLKKNKSLFTASFHHSQMFDVDEDGILNLMEAQHVCRCLGFKGFDEKSVNQ